METQGRRLTALLARMRRSPRWAVVGLLAIVLICVAIRYFVIHAQ